VSLFCHQLAQLLVQKIIKEGIAWEMTSFGADLQATIDLIDKVRFIIILSFF